MSIHGLKMSYFVPGPAGAQAAEALAQLIEAGLAAIEGAALPAAAIAGALVLPVALAKKYYPEQVEAVERDAQNPMWVVQHSIGRAPALGSMRNLRFAETRQDVKPQTNADRHQAELDEAWPQYEMLEFLHDLDEDPLRRRYFTLFLAQEAAMAQRSAEAAAGLGQGALNVQMSAGAAKPPAASETVGPSTQPGDADNVVDGPYSGTKPTRAELEAAYRRGDRDFRGADLSGLYLADMTLDGADFRGAHFRGATLRKTSLKKAKLAGADLRDANMSEASLLEADLKGANLEGANLQEANLEGANLASAKLRGARLLNASFKNADLTDADLTGARLRWASFVHAQMSGVILQGTSLSEVQLAGVDLREVDLSRVGFCGPNPPDVDLYNINPRTTDMGDVGLDRGLRRAGLAGVNLSGMDLRGLDMWGADLSGADLSGADLRGARLGKATLSYAGLQGARLEGADLQGARLNVAQLEGAHLEGADLRGASFVEAQLNSAVLDGAIIDPENAAKLKKKVTKKVMRSIIVLPLDESLE